MGWPPQNKEPPLLPWRFFVVFGLLTHLSIYNIHNMGYNKVKVEESTKHTQGSYQMKTIESNPNAPEIAETIMNQINSLDFWARARWGVREVVCLNLASALPGVRLMGVKGNGFASRSKIDIQLNGKDLYTVRLIQNPTTKASLYKNAVPMELARCEDVYADMLVKVIDGMVDHKKHWHQKPVEA